MSQDRQFEQLVQTIADRVRAELDQSGGSRIASSRPAHHDDSGHRHIHGQTEHRHGYGQTEQSQGHGQTEQSHGYRQTEQSHGDHGHGHSPGKPCKAGKGECTGCGWSLTRRPDDVAKIIDLGAHRVSSGLGLDGGAVRSDLARYIDHTLLKANASRDELKTLCREAAQYKFASVCVNAGNVSYCARELRGSGVPVVAVVGFPLGAMTPAAKGFETREAVRDGAEEIDMVINIGALKSKDYALVLQDMQSVVQAAGSKKVKVILETGELSREEKIVACALSKVAGAAFVKTSTGFGPGGATTDDVALMKAVVGEELEVKASGGVRTADDVDAMIKAGATRIGASASIAIVRGVVKAPESTSKVKKFGGAY